MDYLSISKLPTQNLKSTLTLPKAGSTRNLKKKKSTFLSNFTGKGKDTNPNSGRNSGKNNTGSSKNNFT
jgi:hypothetical protein